MRCGGLTLPIDRFPTTCRERTFGERERRAPRRNWRSLWQRWQDTPAQPLRVVGVLANGYVPAIDEAIHLDGLLSAACMSLYASATDDGIERYVVPLPLSLAWVSPAGDPLWLATELRPVGAAVRGAAYLHSRYPTDRADLAIKQSALTTAGRYKDTRMPLAITVADQIEGWCIGDHAAVTMLLDRVTHVGRKAVHGRGRVLRWIVEGAPEITPEDVLDRRAVPVEYLAAIGESIDARRLAPRLGWTPPYWHAASQAPVRTAAWTR